MAKNNIDTHFKRIAATCALLFCSPLFAADYHVSGFATAAGGFTSSGDHYYYYDNSMSYRSDSKIGLQADILFNPDWKLTLQGIARGSNPDDYEGELEWVYLQYNIIPDMDLKLGRQRLPLYKYSDYLDVGYAYHWITPPIEVYNIVPITWNDGISWSSNFFHGDWESNIHAFVSTFEEKKALPINPLLGDSQQEIPVEGEMASLDYTLTRDALELRAIYADVELTAAMEEVNPMFNSLLTGLRAAGFADAADNLQVKDESASFTGVSIYYDTNDYFVGSEYARGKVNDSLLNKSEGWYITGGIRTGSLTTHLTYAWRDSDAPTDIANSIFVPPLQAAVSGLVNSTAWKQESKTIGIRYDYKTSLAFKAEYSLITDDINENSADLFRFSVDVVF